MTFFTTSLHKKISTHDPWQVLSTREAFGVLELCLQAKSQVVDLEVRVSNVHKLHLKDNWKHSNVTQYCQKCLNERFSEDHETDYAMCQECNNQTSMRDSGNWMRINAELLEKSTKFEESAKKLLNGPLKGKNIVIFSKYSTTLKLLLRVINFKSTYGPRP